MLIINRYAVTAAAPVLATNNAEVATGITGTTWGGINPALATGATGNATAGNGLTNVTAIPKFVDQVISVMLQVDFVEVLTAGQANYVRIPLVNLGITGNKKVRAVMTMGSYNEDAVEDNNTPTPSWMMTVDETAIKVAVVKDCIAIYIPAASIALYQNKALSLLVCYSNT